MPVRKEHHAIGTPCFTVTIHIIDFEETFQGFTVILEFQITMTDTDCNG